ncbi:MAG TPA: efflux RND transporter permease subunit [Candidatus Limnocylindria bacterium]|nr:efflux RND transporter permease subunit [Candidatus Limnocylindria bacterium]
MNLVQIALRRPLTVIVLVVALALGAWVSIQRMTRDIFPPLGVPTIYVAQPFGGMDPAQMEGYLTYRYEYHFLYISGIEHVESKSIQGASIMKLQFHPGTDMSQAMSETVSYVNRARAFMPLGTPAPFIMRFDAGSVAVGYLVFSTEDPNITLSQMQDQALNRVRPAFATLPGVSAPPPFGGSSRGIIINVNPDRMRSYGLSPDAIVQALSHGNTISPSGNMNLGDKYPIVPVNAIVSNIKDLESVALKRGPNGPVFVRDVATVEDGADVVTSYALANGRRTVYLPVTKRGDASTLAVVDLVKKNLPEFQKLLPDGIKVSYEFDQSPVVKRSIRDLLKEGGLGAILTGLMVLLFLRDWRSAFIVIVNIPLSLCAAAFGLWAAGQNVNLMTLGGMALAVGILVDEATVTMENIHTHLARGGGVARAARDATEETTLPRLLAMLCILAVFIPAFFMVGAAKALFVPMALSVGFSMIASYFLSSTLVPVLTVWLVKAHPTAAPKASSVLDRAAKGFGSFVRGSLGLRWLVTAVYAVTAGLIIWLCGNRLGIEIFPKTDTGQFAVRFRAPSGTQVGLTEQIAQKILASVAREAGGTNQIEVSIGLVGVHNSSFPVNLVHLWNGGPEEGWLAVQLKPESGIRIEAFKERLRATLARELPEVRLSFEPQDIVTRVMSFGSTTPIEVAISGPNIGVSKGYAEKILERMKKIPFLRDVQIAQTLDSPSINVDVDRERAGVLGVKVDDVTKSLVAATTSSRFTVANFWADSASGISYNLQVQIPESRTQTIEDLRNIPVATENDRTVLLRNVASFTPGTVVGTYERYNMARVVSVTANIQGTDLGHAVSELRRALAEVGGPPDAKTKLDVRGQIVPLNQLLDGFRSGLIITVVVIFLLLTANFQSLQLSLVVVSTVPAVLAGTVLALWLTGTTLNIQSAMGAIMSIGVAVANAILLVTFAERARLLGKTPKDAAVDGAQSRLRPILMTSLAMIAGMMPMALGWGDGGDQTAPLGRAVVGGLALATVATLFVLPSVFVILRGQANTKSRSLDPDDPLSRNFTRPSGHN